MAYWRVPQITWNEEFDKLNSLAIRLQWVDASRESIFAKDKDGLLNISKGGMRMFQTGGAMVRNIEEAPFDACIELSTRTTPALLNEDRTRTELRANLYSTEIAYL
ncbi:hypothetical protein HYQ45_000030 [Verticillium longisporum]|uniref:Uncharacterized protein n=1 Tax=Verticillium longisporum TaxID=100787 RepID=A0A0G4N544_VERLO|nr:hypothetical protein HYQ44_013311 [Verticillium longisporum]KAG7143754.1 hypothetical protein HYQ45_000030 [Verticillium longisporum]CRK41425.1 hypothetical protein BN1708_001779 [Verticillium longisporum]